MQSTGSDIKSNLEAVQTVVYTEPKFSNFLKYMQAKIVQMQAL